MKVKITGIECGNIVANLPKDRMFEAEGFTGFVFYKDHNGNFIQFHKDSDVINAYVGKDLPTSLVTRVYPNAELTLNLNGGFNQDANESRT